jgi:hypothetical protein
MSDTEPTLDDALGGDGSTGPHADQVDQAEKGEQAEPQAAVTDPAKLIRLGTMLQALTVEVREADTDEASRRMLAQIHNETKAELASVLSPDLMDELTEFNSCCDDNGIPTEAELRVAQAQLVGWLQGLLQGLQASMMAQQATAGQQLRELAGQSGGGGGKPGAGTALPHQSGTYL